MTCVPPTSVTVCADSPAVGMKQRNRVQDDAVAAGVRGDSRDVRPDAITDRA